MSAVNSVITTNAAPAGFTAAGILGNLTKVLEEVHPRKADKMIADGMITEEQLFAAFAFGELDKKNPKAAKAILQNMREEFVALKKGGDIRPLYTAMKKALENAAARGKISTKESQEIIQTALGMAQLDNKSQYLSARRIQFEDKGTVAAGTTYMDRILTRIADNQAFSSADVKVAEKRMAELAAKGASYAPFTKEATKVDHQGVVATGQVLTPTPVSNGSDVQFNQFEFGYLPASAVNGNALVQIPAEHSAQVNLVEFLNSAGEVVASAVPNQVNQLGCRVALFDKRGDEFASGFTIRFSFNNRNPHYWEISDSKKVTKYMT